MRQVVFFCESIYLYVFQRIGLLGGGIAHKDTEKKHDGNVIQVTVTVTSYLT